MDWFISSMTRTQAQVWQEELCSMLLAGSIMLMMAKCPMCSIRKNCVFKQRLKEEDAAAQAKNDLTWQQKAEQLSSNELRTELGKLDIAQLKEIIKEYAISGGSKLGTKQQAYVDFVHHSLRLMNRLEEKKPAKEVDGEKEIQKAFDRIESANLRPVQKSKVLAMIRGYEDGTTDLRVDDVYFAPVVEDRNFAIVYFTNVKENKYGAVSFMYTGEASADDVSDKPRSQLKQLAHFDWNEREIVYQGKTDYTGLTKKDTTREQQAQRLRDSIDNAKKQGEAAKPTRYSSEELFDLQSELNGAEQPKAKAKASGDPGTFTLPAGADGYSMTENEVTYHVVKHLFDTMPSLVEIVQDNNVNDASRKIKKELMKQKFKAKGSGFLIEVRDDPNAARKDDAEAGIYIDVHKHGPTIHDEEVKITNFRDDVVKLYKERISQGLGPVPQHQVNEDFSNVVENNDEIRATEKATGTVYEGKVHYITPGSGTINLVLSDGQRAAIPKDRMDQFDIEIIKKAEKKRIAPYPNPYEAKIGKNIDFSADGGIDKRREMWHKDHPADTIIVLSDHAGLIAEMEKASKQLEQKYEKEDAHAATNRANDSDILEGESTADVPVGTSVGDDSKPAGVDGERAGGNRTGAPGKQSASGGSGGEGASDGVGNDHSDGAGQKGVSRKPAGAAAGIKAADFTITSELDDLGGAVKKVRQNVDAIRLARALEQEGRNATPEEQQTLAKYVGWGGLPNVFNVEHLPGIKEFRAVRELVEEGIITEAEWKEMRASTKNAHYTSPKIVKAMFDGLRHLGFTGGRVLEPSMGTGNFFGLMPGDMTASSLRTGIELDPITGLIAQKLYPNAEIHVKGFEKYKVADGFFDVAVGNVPFGDYQIVDPEYKTKNGKSHLIHNYFFAKSIDKVRDGGIVMFITSTGTLNTDSNQELRAQLAAKADFLGAIRLPGDAFKANAGTEVTTDIIVLQKRPAGQAANHAGDFVNTYKEDIFGEDGSIEADNNVYFRQHPDMVLGEYVPDKLAFGKRLGVKSDGRDMEQAIQDAFAKMPEGTFQGRAIAPKEFKKKQEAQASENGWRDVDDGAYYLEGGKVMQRQGDRGEASKLSDGDEKRVKSMVPVRDSVRKLLRLMRDADVSDEQVAAQQKELNRVYDNFTKQFGPLNSPKNKNLMRHDPVGSGALFSIERYEKDGKTEKADKNAIFTTRTIRPAKTKEQADSAEEALILSLFDKGKLDFAHMSDLTGFSQDELIAKLGDRIYMNPSYGEGVWEMSDAYLSGNVRKKLKEAQAAAEKNPDFARNVEALKRVQPRDLEGHELTVRIGSQWVPTEDYEQFINDTLRTNRKVKVSYDKITATWKIEENFRSGQSLAYNVRNTDEFGVRNPRGRDYTMIHMLIDTLNMKPAKVTYTMTEGDKTVTVVDDERTAQAANIQEQLQQMFGDWLFSNKEREARLLTYYNETFNNVKLREYKGELVYGEGNEHVPIPGFANEVYKLRPHQKDAVWRMLQGKNTLLAHVVGAGKTLEMIVGAMEMRRLGIANKPLMVVPNKLVGQMHGDIFAAYPGAKVLKLTSDDVPSVAPLRSKKMTNDEYKKRQEKNRLERASILSKIATGDYDIILMSHDLFSRLPVSPERQQQHIEREIQEVREAIEGLKSEHADKTDHQTDGNLGSQAPGKTQYPDGRGPQGYGHPV
jgi:N12 class adenine-specific DNA methylase